MGKRSNRRVLNAVQNVLIAVLAFSALFLLSRADLIRGEALGHVFVSSGTATAPQGQSVASHMPVRIAARTSGACSAWFSAATDGAVFEEFSPLLSESIASAAEQETTSEEEFRRALENDCIYYDFTATLPMSFFMDLLGGGDCPNVSVRALLLSSLENDTLVLYAWQEDKGVYYRWQTAVPADSLSSAAERRPGTAAEFAFLSGEHYQFLAPYTLLTQDTAALPDLAAQSLTGTEEYDAFLTALEFNVHSNFRYALSDGTEVTIQSQGTLYAAPGGTVTYSGNGGGIPLLTVPHTGEDATAEDAVAAARNLAAVLLGERLGDGAVYLLSVENNRQGSVEVLFGYMLQGVPIEFPEGYAMRVTIENNTVTAFTLHLRRYTLTNRSTSLLPVLQAAAAVRPQSGAELLLGYFDDGGDTLQPTWLRK